MKLIIGLGNPGKKYTDTRHNIGFTIIDRLAKEIGETALKWEDDKKNKVLVAKTADVIFAKPQTFMNLSGGAVKGVADYYKINPADIWVIHDDLDLPLGKIRIREGGASAGHNGVDSIIKSLGTDKFTRFRMGIGRGKESKEKTSDQHYRHQDVIDFVLSKFNRSEAGSMKHLINNGTDAVRIALTEGTDKAMNRFN